VTNKLLNTSYCCKKKKERKKEKEKPVNCCRGEREVLKHSISGIKTNRKLERQWMYVFL
jgi:hypothetical protein